MIGPDRPNPLIYGDFEDMVTLVVRGERFRVPEGVPLIRALQYMQFELGRLTCDWSLFCFNDTIGCCACKVRKPGAEDAEGARACCLKVEEGLEVVRLPRSARVLPSALSLAEDALGGGDPDEGHGR